MTNMKIRKGGIVKYLLLVLFLLTNNFISCYMENYNIDDYDNINDEQTVNILKEEYFTEEERDFILSHLKVVSSRLALNETKYLGETIYHDINDYEITFYEDSIEKYSRNINLPPYFVRGLTVIHELCHVLYPNHSHDDVWLNCFESKLKEYCQSCIDTDLADYYGDETKFKSEDDLIEYIVYHKTNSYKQLNKQLKEARELIQSLKKSKMMDAK